MKIVVLKGSPRPNGNSNALADEFIRGAKANAMRFLSLTVLSSCITFHYTHSSFTLHSIQMSQLLFLK